MSEDKRNRAHIIGRELVSEYPAFANVPQAERERLAEYWAVDSFIDEFGVLRSVTGTPLKDSLRYALEQKAEAIGAPNAKTPAAADKRHSIGITDSDIAAIKDPQRRLEVLGEVEGGCRVVPSWQRGPARPVTIGEITSRTGLTAEQFAKLDPTRKLEIENEVKHLREAEGAR
ncbi:hypothetical protein [Methylosinus sp. LW4]|uniref:hypothetical protein n=1 Tax=Methylosinus sp. LW4 TaxID=136993 RepID=UPI000376A217|nr:hypothetical protein [Methylosinus sp. LW4]